jgi:DNA-binding transcriptional regulator YdaS (Cro superfamily)
VKNTEMFGKLRNTPEGLALLKVIDHCGGTRQMREILGVPTQTIDNWVHLMGHVSPEGAKLIDDIIGAPKETLRPDITDWESALRPKRNLVSEMKKTPQGRALIMLIQKAGGRSAFAIKMGVAKEIVDNWVWRGALPISKAIMAATVFQMDVSSVRPDKFTAAA